MSKWCYNYDSGKYEDIDEDGYNRTRGEYSYNWDDSEYKREREEEERREREEREEEERRREEEEEHRREEELRREDEGDW